MVGVLVVIAVVGVLVLAGLAAWVGYIEGNALNGAWRRVATARRGQNLRETCLDEREGELDDREAFLDGWERRLRRQQDS